MQIIWGHIFLFFFLFREGGGILLIVFRFRTVPDVVEKKKFELVDQKEEVVELLKCFARWWPQRVRARCRT